MAALDSDDVAVIIYIDGHRARIAGQAGHEHHVAGYRDYEARTGSELDIVDVESPALGSAHALRIISKGVLGFSDADWQALESPLAVAIEIRARRFAEDDAVGAVNLDGDYQDLGGK